MLSTRIVRLQIIGACLLAAASISVIAQRASALLKQQACEPVFMPAPKIGLRAEIGHLRIPPFQTAETRP